MSRQVTKTDLGLLTPLGRRLAGWLIPYLATWVTPNQITFFGFVCLLAAGLALYMASFAKAWLLLAIAGIIVHWLTDELDGEFARVRGLTSERGFFLDLFLDGVGATTIMLGLAFASYTRFALMTLFLVLYLHRSILEFMIMVLRHRFVLRRFSTPELRVLVIIITLLTFVQDGPIVTLLGHPLGWFDLALLTCIPIAFLEWLITAFRFYHELEPPRRNESTSDV